jgi:hypothetical protein
MMTTYAGGGASNPGDGGPATSATLQQPFGLAIDSTGNLLIADVQANDVRIVSATGTITLFAGTGTGGDGGLATAASLSQPRGVAAGTNVYYIADTGDNKIRKVQ